MKKIILAFFITLALSFLILATANAEVRCDESKGNPLINGLVPCGRNLNPNGTLSCPCELYHIFYLIKNIYVFLVWYISIPLAGLLIMTGGILLLVGGGYPKLHDTGKRILWGTAFGLALVLGAWLIIGIVFWALGFTGTWWSGFPIG